MPDPPPGRPAAGAPGGNRVHSPAGFGVRAGPHSRRTLAIGWVALAETGVKLLS